MLLPLYTKSAVCSQHGRRWLRAQCWNNKHHYWHYYPKWYHATTTETAAAAAAAAVQSYYLAHAAVMIPHDSKRPHGEDAAAANSQMLIVADGVGGWASEGVDAGAFSRKLTHTLLSQKMEGSLKQKMHQANLQTASQHLGSATCTALQLSSSSNSKNNGIGSVLETCNVGDSGYSIFRKHSEEWKLLYTSPVGQKEFNFPDQLGGTRFGDDARVVGMEVTHPVEEHDFIIAYTDGVSDNLEPTDFWNESISALLSSQQQQDDDDDDDDNLRLRQVADNIARRAYFLGKDPNYLSPFAKGARKAGWGASYNGGKQDDITVMVAQVKTGTSPPIDQKTGSIWLYVEGVQALEKKREPAPTNSSTQ